MHIGLTELLLIAVVIIFLLKPDKLTEYLKKFFYMKSTIQNAKEEVDKQMNDLKNNVSDLEEAAIDNIEIDNTNNKKED